MNLHKTSKLHLTACVLAAVLLCGCSNEGIKKPPVTVIGNDSGAIPLESALQPISSEIPLESGAQTIPGSTGPIYNISFTLSGSPDGAGSDEYRQMTLENGVVKISGKTGKLGLKNISATMSKVDFKKQSDGSFTCTISNGPLLKGYIDILFEDNRGVYSDLRLRFINGKFAFPDVLDIAESNKSLVSGEIPTDAKGITLKNITKDGSAGNAAKVLEEIRALSNEICAGIDSSYEKLRAISKWVSENIYYDHDSFSAGIPSECLSLEFMLENKRSVCGGYANMTAALAQAQGITCYSIAGEAVNNGTSYAEVTKGEVHEWNYALTEGRGIWIDSGWNSTNHYRNGRYSSDIYRTMYFDIGNEYFALDHKALKISDRNFFGI